MKNFSDICIDFTHVLSQVNEGDVSDCTVTAALPLHEQQQNLEESDWDTAWMWASEWGRLRDVVWLVVRCKLLLQRRRRRARERKKGRESKYDSGGECQRPEVELKEPNSWRRRKICVTQSQRGIYSGFDVKAVKEARHETKDLLVLRAERKRREKFDVDRWRFEVAIKGGGRKEEENGRRGRRTAVAGQSWLYFTIWLAPDHSLVVLSLLRTSSTTRKEDLNWE